MKRLFKGSIAALIAVLLTTSVPRVAPAADPDPAVDPPDSGASDPRPSDNNLITMNFQDVDIAVLAKFISQITGRNLVVDESVRGKVSVIAPSKVTPEQAYKIFQSVLQVKGFTTVKAGAVIKVVPSRDIRESAELTESQQPGETRGDEYVTRMVKLKNIDANSLVNVIQPMISRDGLVAAFPETNTLILTDDGWNIERLLQIIGSLDAEGIQQEVAVMPLKLAYADQVATEIQTIMNDRGVPGGATNAPRPGFGSAAPSAQGPSGAFKVVPDERTNSLIVLAGALPMRQIRDLVEKLDVHSPNATSRIHVYYLKYAQALEMVQVLGSLLGGSGSPSQLTPQTGKNSLGRSSGGGSGSFYSGFGGGSSSLTGMSGSSGFGGFGGLSSTTFGGNNGGFGGGASGLGGGLLRNNLGSGTTSSATIGISNNGGGGPGSDFESPVRITADPATNSLVISALPQDYETLRTIVGQLDIPRRQVFVQGVILEVSEERQRELGITWQTYGGSGSVLGIGQLNFGQLQNALTNPLGVQGLALGLASGGTCTIPTSSATTVTTTNNSGTASGTMTVPCDIALIHALEADTHSNVLSAPTLLTADNEEATIVVGQNVPFLANSSASAGLPNTIFSSVDRQNVGITLDIVPQVTDGGYVRMDVYEEVSNVVAGTQNNTLGPTTTIRSASTTVLVQNHRTTVIGGLISDDTERQNQGTPFLSKIPVVGNFFSDTARSITKNNLIVFLTPHVIRDREDLRELSLDEREKFLRSLNKQDRHDLPMSQVRELYKPTWSIPVSPGADLSAPPPPVPGDPISAPHSSIPTGGYAPAPMNTEEVGRAPIASAGSAPTAATESPLSATLPTPPRPIGTGLSSAPTRGASSISSVGGAGAGGPASAASSAPLTAANAVGAADSSAGAATSASALPSSVEGGEGKTGGVFDGVTGLFGARP